MENLLTLQAKRVKETKGVYKGYYRTEFYLHGQLYAIVHASIKQPKRGKKTMVINCWNWALQWV